MPKTFFEKVWADHVIADLGDDTCLLHIDRLFLHDLSGSVAMRLLETSGRTPPRPELIFSVIDHLIDSAPGRGPSQSYSTAGAEMILAARRIATSFGFTFFDTTDPRQGIVHVVSPEQGIALPGTTLVCGDSHTCTVGGIGALAWGIGSSEIEHVLATQTLVQTKPKTMRVRFDGELADGVYSKDMILYLIGKFGADGGSGYAVEYTGTAVKRLSVEGRLTLCNMSIEFGAKYGFIPPDDITFDYLKGRPFCPKGPAWEQAVAYWTSLTTEADAEFDAELSVDCTQIQPQVTFGTSPEHVCSIDGTVPQPAGIDDSETRQSIEKALAYMQLSPGMRLDGVPIDAAYIGSCTNARLSDLRIAAGILKGHSIAPGIQAICVPGSSQVKAAAEAEGLDRIFKAAGFEWHESGCSMCVNLGQERLAKQRVISTTNRNFEGRQGPLTRTHLASPATVAASAITGFITDPRKPLPIH